MLVDRGQACCALTTSRVCVDQGAGGVHYVLVSTPVDQGFRCCDLHALLPACRIGGIALRGSEKKPVALGPLNFYAQAPD